MLTKAEIYHWFRDIQAWNRIDLICNLIRLCNPFELRFIGSCIEDMNLADCKVLNDQETKANNLQNLEQFIKKGPPIDEFQSHIAICIALLKSDNYKVAAKMGDLLQEKVEGLNSQQLMETYFLNEIEQWMLLLALAYYHPAFNFNKQLKFKEKLAEYERMQRREKQICRSRHLPQKSRLSSNQVPLGDGEWTTNLHPTAVPFMRYPGHHTRGYVDYYNKSYQPHIQGRIDNGYIVPTTMRPSNFPATLISPTVMGDPPVETFYPPAFMRNPTHPLVYSNCQTQDKVHISSSDVYPSSAVTSWNSPVVGDGFPSSSYIPGVNDDAQPATTSFQSTVTQPKTLVNVTSALSTVVTMSVATSLVSCSKSFDQMPTAAASYAPDSANPTSEFIIIPTSSNIETLTNKACYEIRTNQQCKIRNRSHSGDTSSNGQRRSGARTVTHFSAQPLRSSTSAPILATSMGQINAVTPSKGTGSSDKMSSQSTVNARARQIPKPMNLFVTSKGKNASYSFEITWTDGTTSACDHTVQEIIYFYKHVASKLHKNSAIMETFTKQNNQMTDRSTKLQSIFRNFINNYVEESSIEDILRFFKHNMPPPMSHPRRKYRQASKSRQAVDGSSSSSSTSSPPLVNSTKSKLLQSSVPGLHPTTSPPPAKSVISTSSIRSSPSSIACIPTNTEEITESSLNDRNDPFLKLYYWLKDRNLTDVYTYLKKYKFDEFCKLQPEDIDSLTSLSTQQKNNVKEEMVKMPKKRTTGVVAINMEALSISSKASSSDTSSDNGKIMDIKSVLSDVARQSEDERSGSSQSAPVSFTNCSNPDVAISDASFSFEFEGAENDEKTTPSSQTNEFQNNPSEILCVDRISVVEPPFAFSQDGVHSVNDVSSRPRYLQPTVPNMRYCAGPYDNPQHLTHNWFHCAYNHSYLPSSYKVMSNVPTQTSMGNVVARTIPSPVYSQSSKPSQHVYTDTGLESQRTIQSDTVMLPYPQAMRPPSHSNASQPRQNWDLNSRTSPTSSDPDSALKHHSDLITTECVIPNLPVTAYPSRSCYSFTPRYGSLHQPPSVGRTTHPLSPSFSDSTIYPLQTQRNFNKCEHNQPNITSSVSAHAMNGYLESRPASHRMHQDSNRGQYKRHNYGDGPKKGHVVHCCNCGKKGHNSTACRNLGAMDVPKSDFQLEISSSMKLKTNK